MHTPHLPFRILPCLPDILVKHPTIGGLYKNWVSYARFLESHCTDTCPAADPTDREHDYQALYRLGRQGWRHLHLDLPDPNARSLLPGFQLAPVASTVVRSIPSNPVLLDGHDLGFPTTVISVMQANWSTHIPLNVLTTHALLASADDAYQSVVIGEGGLRVVPPKLNEKDEPLMTYQEWFQAYPRLVTCIRKYLPRYGDEVADMWKKHFAATFARIDFFENFHLYLQYDIFVRDTSPTPLSIPQIGSQMSGRRSSMVLRSKAPTPPSLSPSHRPPPLPPLLPPLGLPPIPFHRDPQPASLPHPSVRQVPLPGTDFAVFSAAASHVSIAPVEPLPQITFPSPMDCGRQLRVSKSVSDGTVAAAPILRAIKNTPAPAADPRTLRRLAASEHGVGERTRV